MSLTLNPAAVQFAKRLIEDGHYYKNDQGHWGEHNPNTNAQNDYLSKHEIEEYGQWHLGLDMSKAEDKKGRYHFPYGDYKTIHRDGLLAAKEHAAQQGYTDIEKAADELLQTLEAKAAK